MKPGCSPGTNKSYIQIIIFLFKVSNGYGEKDKAPKDKDSPSNLMMSYPTLPSFAVFVFTKKNIAIRHHLTSGPHITSEISWAHNSVREGGGLMTNESHMFAAFPIRSPRFGSF